MCTGQPLVKPVRAPHTEQWDKAHQDFFEAFKNYDEAGSPRRI